MSSYLFILVSQILTALLNDNLTKNLIPGFNPYLNYNFNQLMYANDLILITLASRKAARNINICLSIYSNLSGQ